jgi:hypothetical protein
VKKKKLIFLLLISLLSSLIFSSVNDGPVFTTQTAATAPGTDRQFSLFFLIKAETIKKTQIPQNAVRLLKSYTVRVRPFLQNSKYYDFSPKAVHKAADDCISKLSFSDMTNAVKVADGVYNYISESISSTAESSADFYAQAELASPAGVLEAKRGNNIERCRLAVAMLRYMLIPSRTAYWDDHHAVEYFLKPSGKSKAEPAWHIMDLTGVYQSKTGEVEPVSWHPVHSNEKLSVQAEPGALIAVNGKTKNNRYEINESEAFAMFANIKQGIMAEAGTSEFTTGYYLLKQTDYIIRFSDTRKAAKVVFMMDFNELKPFKTMRFFVRPGPGLRANYKKSETLINPPVSGIEYTLPVEFEAVNTAVPEKTE